MIVIKRRGNVLNRTFQALKAGTVGVLSEKHLIKERRQLALNIRHEISLAQIAKGLSGVVLEEDFTKMLHRYFIVNLAEERIVKAKKKLFNCFVGILRHSQWAAQSAKKHWFRLSAGKCFYAWSEWNFLVSVGLDRKKWKSARRYEVRYNHKRLDYFARIRQIRIVWIPWKARHLLMRLVKLKLRTYLTAFIRKYFDALRTITGAQHVLRAKVIHTWQTYATEIMGTPFHAWANLAFLARTSIREKTRIATAYRRWKARQFHKIILRTWRHQALYGRTDGMYSRAMLAKGLKSQKALADRLEKLMVSQAVELEECKELIDREILKRFELEGKLQVATGDIHRQEMFSHHAEQEVKRIEAIVEVMAIINPRQIEHLKRLQPAFRFKERNIVPAASVASVSVIPKVG